ncbi:MAG: rhodanese-like domain-containing protein [Chloroflexota bacterium]
MAPRIPDVPSIPVTEAHDLAESGDAVILDVRESDELETKSIDGALHLPLSEMRDRYTELPEDKQLLVICESGVRSAFVTEMLQQSGYQDTVNISGGMQAWQGAGLPLKR